MSATPTRFSSELPEITRRDRARFVKEARRLRAAGDSTSSSAPSAAASPGWAAPWSRPRRHAGPPTAASGQA